MSLELHTITFNHDPATANTSAMSIRRNKDFEVEVPEYDADVPRSTADSCAAYSISDTAGQNVVVHLRLRISAPANVSYDVKAKGGGVLGKLDTVQAVFAGGATEVTLTLPLAHRKFNAVGRHDITWNWRYRPAGGGAWQSLVATSHRIYLVLAIPPAPWTQAAADKRNPWTDLLDESCTVAAGSTGATGASRLIVKRVHSAYSLRYDIVSGAPRYDYWQTGSSFQLTNWIDYVVRGNAPVNPVFCNGSAEEYRHYRIVNCYDCAAAVTLMTQVLGVAMDYQFHGPFGYLRYVEPIGRGKCNNPFYGCMGNNPAVGEDDPRSWFGNHAYPKSGGRNFDACMREWVPPLLRFLLLLIWLLVLILTLGLVNLQSLRDRADGWLIDLTQPDYNTKTIDTSQAFEANAAAGGAPQAQTMQFQVV